MKKWRPSDATVQDEWKVICQIVVPEEYRKEVMSLADDSKMTEHLGVKKACNMILVHFYRPNIRRDVVEDCITCSICKVMGKPNQNICVAPLRPVPVSEVSFCRVIVDCVGPLPNTKEGNLCLLTIMCAST